jgi:hypothetical protein
MSATARHLHVRAASLPQRFRLLIIELGASPLRREGSDEFDETVAIPQQRGELPVAFAQRTLLRLALAERSGRHLGAAAILTGPRCDAAALSARRLIALGLVAHGRRHPGSCGLSLEAEANASEPVLAALLELVDELTSSAEGDPGPVRLCFARASGSPSEPKSGTFCSVPLEPTQGRPVPLKARQPGGENS